MRVVFVDNQLAKACCARRLAAERWGEASGGIELALCTLRAGRSLKAFLALPNVSKENDAVIFTTTTTAVRLILEGVSAGDAPFVVIHRIEALARKRG